MIKITYNGHSCFEIEYQGKNIIIDPFLTGNPNSKKKPEEVKADLVLISHAHADHFGQADMICKNNENCILVSSFEVVNYATMKKGVKNAHPLHIGGEHDFGFCKVKLTTALHGSSDEDNINVGVAAGLIIRIDGKTIYHAGDTGLFSDMRLIGDRENIYIAMLPIGDNFTMGINDAAYSVEMLKPEKVIPMHYNTFPVIESDPEEFLNKLPSTAEGIVMGFGESKEF